MIPKGKKLGLLVCEDTGEWAKENDMFPKCVSATEAEYQLFYCFDGELPCLDPESLSTFFGFIIGGSHHDSYATDEWILDLIQWIKDYSVVVNELKHGPRLVGICFGAQVIGIATGWNTKGGKVAKNQKRKAFTFGIDRINVRQPFLEQSYVKKALEEAGRTQGDSLLLYKSHGDAVNALPPEGAVLFADSKNAHVEIFGVGENIIGIQGHPEFKKRHMESILPNVPLESEEYAKNAAAVIESEKEDGDLVGRMLFYFLVEPFST